MDLLTPLTTLLGTETELLAGRFRRNAVTWTVIALFALVGLGFLLVAAYTGMVLWVGPIWAPIILGAVFLLIALVVYGISLIVHDIAHRRELQRRESAEAAALVTTAAMAALPVLMKSPLLKTVGLPLGGVIAAAVLLSQPGQRTTKRPP